MVIEIDISLMPIDNSGMYGHYNGKKSPLLIGIILK